MGYWERVPGAELRGIVSCVWGHGDDLAGGSQLVVPDACVDLIWRAGRVEAVGPDTRAWVSELDAGQPIFGIRAAPGMARSLLGVPAGEVRDLRLDAAELWGAEMRDLGEAIGERPELAPVMLEDFARRRLTEWAPDPAVAAAVSALDVAQPPSISALAHRIGVSERQLRRRIGDAVGYGPQTLVGVLRFQRTARSGGREPLADLAHRCGYADQAHLTREFRKLAGTTPKRYFASS
ncbi:helix-turn-helix transcriptional regulator [Saccharopolyspora mangrovi]|uniref:Helix-turn-helix transcriptional regulator n=1 Tax=Saccharopolyspora mangrovi TaxID=3082379 RepID=A0ABU6A933_9PSEU|nr:helix-turn-helix transcriptional regulator [Saccharopolyspora sp. S2-29]MEB3367967.1 helix-turn-helix transcriptional regulator [Saccharopolyspora sp. S2-29]